MNGVLYVLEHVPGAGETVVYRGRVEISGTSAPLEVCIEPAATPDGLRATAAAPQTPAEWRPWVERLAAAMAKSAVRSAHRLGRRPPRRLQRWRELP